ncbi:hypothetical protein P692DRAFT_20827875 [Suillus brevipes Sb2]|nr:hypothetical protein P692DRAFT_20827875 [Suillus brevipes Sb2]
MSAGIVTAICLKEYFKRTSYAQNIIQDILKIMRLHFVLTIVAACKLASSLPISDESQCATWTCEFETCCPGSTCQIIPTLWTVIFFCMSDNRN